jgi:hypothetical protein
VEKKEKVRELKHACGSDSSGDINLNIVFNIDIHCLSSCSPIISNAVSSKSGKATTPLCSHICLCHPLISASSVNSDSYCQMLYYNLKLQYWTVPKDKEYFPEGKHKHMMLQAINMSLHGINIGFTFPFS